MAKLTAKQKKHIKDMAKEYEENLTEHMTNVVISGGSFIDEVSKIAKKASHATADFVTSEQGQKAIEFGLKEGLPIAIKILAGNVARINHLSNLPPLTKEEIEFYEANHDKHMHGGSFWTGFYDGFKSILKPGLDIIAPIVTKMPIPVGSLAFGALDKVVGQGVRKQGGYRVAGDISSGGAHHVAGNDYEEGSMVRIAGAHRVKPKQKLLGQDEVSRPPKHYREYQREMMANDYI